MKRLRIIVLASAIALSTLSANAQSSVPAPSPKVVGDWTVTVTVSPQQQAPIVIAESRSRKDIESLFGRRTFLTMRIMCEANNTSLVFDFGENFMSDIGAYGSLSYSVDGAAPAVLVLKKTVDNHGLGLLSGRESIPVIQGLFATTQLTLTATTYQDRTISAVIPTKGLEEAVAPLRAACNW